MAAINQFSFLRFDDGSGTDPEALPQAYILERCRYPFMPIIVPGEFIAFYINTRFGYDYGTGLILQFVKNGTVIYESNSLLQYDALDVDHYNLYANFAIPTLTDGVYYIRILRSSRVQVLESNPVLCMNSDYENVSAYVEFTNDQNLYNVRYASLTAFYQKFRLRITDVTGGDYEDDNSSYRAVTTGKYRDLVAMPQKAITFECYFFDKDALEALAVFLAHRTRIINDKEYAFKEGLTHDQITMSKVVKGTFKMYDQSFSTVNKCDLVIASS